MFPVAEHKHKYKTTSKNGQEFKKPSMRATKNKTRNHQVLYF